MRARCAESTRFPDEKHLLRFRYLPEKDPLADRVSAAGRPRRRIARAHGIPLKTKAVYVQERSNPPRDPDTLVALLESLAATRPDDTAYVFLQDGDEGESRMTYAELRDAARRVAVHLLGNGCGQDDPVLLIFNPGLDYICALFGCLYAGAIPVPAYPPAHARRLERLQAVAVDAGARFALTVSEELSRIASFETQQGKRLPVERWLAIDRADSDAGDWTDPGWTARASRSCNTRPVPPAPRRASW